MRDFFYHLLGMTVMLLAFCLAAYVVIPLVQNSAPGRASWHVPVVGGGITAAPVVGLLLFELLTGRALTGRFSVVVRNRSAREYWGWVAFHALFILIIAGTTWAYFSSKQ